MVKPKVKWSKADKALENQLFWGIRRGQIDVVTSLCKTHPWLVADYDSSGQRTWIGDAAVNGNVPMMAAMLDLGFNIDALRLPEKSSALCTAIGFDQYEMFLFLLDRGANVDLDRTIVAAINRKNDSHRMDYVRQLVEYGADVNQLFPLYGDENNLFTALDSANGLPEVADFLRAHGAKTSAELRQGKQHRAATFVSVSQPSVSTVKEVLDYFNTHFGEIAGESIVETIPAGVPITVHVIPPAGARQHHTLFTTGLSTQPMRVPKGQQDFAFAELFIQLPGEWQIKNLADPIWNWPMDWLQRIAQHPHHNKTWLGGAFTIIANGKPPVPLAPNARFTCLLLLAEQDFTRSDGRIVQLYRVVPLYTEERALEIQGGAPALMKAFDEHGTPFVVDLNRKNVGVSSNKRTGWLKPWRWPFKQRRD